MKNFFRAAMAFMMFGLVLTAAGHALEPVVPMALTMGAGLAAIVAKAVFFPSTQTGYFTAGIEVEIFVDYIIKRLRKDNQFIATMKSEDNKVLAGRIVHIPQPGAKPIVRKNRSEFPATAIRRTDTDIVYVLDEYTTDPTHIPNSETVELSYDKIDDVLSDHMETLSQDVGDDLLIKILTALPGKNIIRTSGAAAAATEEGQTGTRKVFVPADLKRVQARMNKENVAKNDRFAILESNMLDQFTNALDTNENRTFSAGYDAVNGIVGRMYGFNIMERSNVAAAKAAVDAQNLLQVNPYGAAIQATDDLMSLCWQKQAVAAAMGEVTPFQDEGNPLYYGDIHSMLVRMGGRRRRADNSGVYGIQQSA